MASPSSLNDAVGALLDEGRQAERATNPAPSTPTRVGGPSRSMHHRAHHPTMLYPEGGGVGVGGGEQASQDDVWRCQECKRDIVVVEGQSLEDALAEGMESTSIKEEGGAREEEEEEEERDEQREGEDFTSKSKGVDSAKDVMSIDHDEEGQRVQRKDGKKEVEGGRAHLPKVALSNVSSTAVSLHGSSLAEIESKARRLQQQCLTAAHSVRPQDRVDVLFKLFSLAAKHAEVQFPLCSDCYQKVMDLLDEKEKKLLKEKDEYTTFISSTRQEMMEEAAEHEADIDDEIKTLQKEEARLLRELEELEGRKEEAHNQILELCDNEKKIDIHERMFWEDVNQFELAHTTLKEESESSKAVQAFLLNRHNRLRTLNILNLCFDIGINGKFGSINGVRMQLVQPRTAGQPKRPPLQNVEQHVNAGFGYIIHLVETLARLTGTVFSKFQPVTQGSTSHFLIKQSGQQAAIIEEPILLKYKPPPKFFSFGRSSSMAKGFQALLYCISDIEKQVKSIDRTDKSLTSDGGMGASEVFYLPNAIIPEEVTIGGSKEGINMANASEEDLQTAFRFILIDLQLLIEWCVRNCRKAQVP
mmetsp:Transcript_32847/g.84833  ORF Transcript_32847/g.84833 Transcript_32847/m.84833 type:complete len:587 (-) Transcript_32847:326-2086(-)